MLHSCTGFYSEVGFGIVFGSHLFLGNYPSGSGNCWCFYLSDAKLQLFIATASSMCSSSIFWSWYLLVSSSRYSCADSLNQNCYFDLLLFLIVLFAMYWWVHILHVLMSSCSSIPFLVSYVAACYAIMLLGEILNLIKSWISTQLVFDVLSIGSIMYLLVRCSLSSITAGL